MIERIDGLDPAGPLFLDERAFQSANQFIEAKSLVNKTEHDNDSSEVLSYFDSFQAVFNQWVQSFNEETPITQTGRLSEEQSERFKLGIRDTIKVLDLTSKLLIILTGHIYLLCSCESAL